MASSIETTSTTTTFKNQNTTYITVDTNNNVGIGTTAPVAPLAVVGGTSNASNLATAYSTAAFNITPKSTSGYSLAFGSGPSDKPYIQMSAGGTAPNDLNLQPYGGNVGIGTTTPNAELGFPIGTTTEISQVATTGHQAGNAGHIALTIADGGNHAGYFVNNTHNGTYSSTHLSLLTGEGGVSVATERMRVTPDGNVGIGTTTPAAKINVASGDGATAVNQAILSGGRTLGGGAVGGAGALLFTNSYWNANKGAALITGVDSGSSGGELTLSTTANGGGQSGVPVERMRIKQDGNVGIGTTAPTSKLQVAGDVDASAGVLKVGSGLSAHQTSRAILEYATNTSTVRCYGATAGTGNFAVKVGGGGGSTDTTALSITTTGDLKFNSGYGSVATAYGCRAWWNFNGTGTVAIRDSGNVSSITDHSSGNYTVNFTVAMPDVNYAVMGGTNQAGSDRWQTFYPPAVGSIRLVNKNSAAGAYDSDGIMGGVFR